MEIFTQIFQNKLDRYFNAIDSINPKQSPDTLLKILKSKSQCKYLKKKLSQPTTNIYKLFKRLTISSLILIYSNKFFQFLNDVPFIPSGNQWIDKEFLEPCHMFLKKLCLSNQLYQNTKKQCPMPVGKNMEMLFYNIGLLKMIFRIVAKMPLLGRYYKPKNEQVICSFINTMAIHAQKVYISFRQILIHMVENPSVHIPTKSDEKIMQVVLRDELPSINEEMKKLFLDKYFYPLGKGIGIKLFRTEELPIESEKVIKGIISDHANTERQRQKSELQNTLFPEPGKVNMKFYEQSLLSNMMIDNDDKYEEEVVDIDVNDQEGDEGEISLEDRFKKICLEQNMLKKNNENDIETGIQRYEESLNEL